MMVLGDTGWPLGVTGDIETRAQEPQIATGLGFRL